MSLENLQDKRSSNILKFIAFLLNDNMHVETEIKTQNHIIPKNIYIGIYLKKHIQDMNTENWNIPVKDMKENIKTQKNIVWP